MTEHELITLKAYIEVRLDEMDKRWQVRNDLNDRAMEGAARALETRLVHLNEFRRQIMEERALYARKEDVDYKLSIIQKELANLCGRTAGKEWSIGVIIAILVSLGSLAYTVLA